MHVPGQVLSPHGQPRSLETFQEDAEAEAKAAAEEAPLLAAAAAAAPRPASPAPAPAPADEAAAQPPQAQAAKRVLSGNLRREWLRLRAKVSLRRQGKQVTLEQALQTYQQLKPRPSWFSRLLRETRPLHEVLLIYAIYAVLFGLCVLCVQFLLALAIYGKQTGISVSASGILINPESPSVAATAATAVELGHLWNFPKLSYEQLRRVQDVVFFHNQCQHVVQVAVVEKSAQSLLIRGFDGSQLRVLLSGQIYWRPPAMAEILLQEMDAWRSYRDPSGWWAGSALAEQALGS